LGDLVVCDYADEGGVGVVGLGDVPGRARSDLFVEGFGELDFQ